MMNKYKQWVYTDRTRLVSLEATAAGFLDKSNVNHSVTQHHLIAKAQSDTLNAFKEKPWYNKANHHITCFSRKL